MNTKFNIMPKVSLILLTILSICSCYYDNEYELYDSNECITENMSFSNDIVPILNRHCQLCHSAESANLIGAGINLESFESLKTYVERGSFLGSIQHRAGYSPMPKGGGKIPNCDIEKIQSWIDSGSPNN